MKQIESDFDCLVAFHTPFPFEGDGFGERLCDPGANGNAMIIRHLAGMGIGSVFVQEGDYYENTEEGQPYAWCRPANSTGSFVRLRPADECPIGGSGIAVVRARARTPAWLTGRVPVINNSSIQAIGNSKWQQYQLFESHMAYTDVVEAGECIQEEAYASFRKGFYMKADAGRRAEQVVSFAERPTPEELEEERLCWGDRPRVLFQETDRGKFIDGVQSYFALDRQEVGIADQRYNQELRLWSFATPNNPRFAAVYKLNFEGGHGRFLMLDIDSLPSEVFDLGHHVVKTLLAETGAPGFIASIDMYKSEHTGQMRLREVNLRDVTITVPDAFEQRNFPQYHLHAEQLAELATCQPL